jgi:hypothetical protein
MSFVRAIPVTLPFVFLKSIQKNGLKYKQQAVIWFDNDIIKLILSERNNDEKKHSVDRDCLPDNLLGYLRLQLELGPPLRLFPVVN